MNLTTEGRCAVPGSYFEEKVRDPGAGILRFRLRLSRFHVAPVSTGQNSKSIVAITVGD